MNNLKGTGRCYISGKRYKWRDPAYTSNGVEVQLVTSHPDEWTWLSLTAFTTIATDITYESSHNGTDWSQVG